MLKNELTAINQQFLHSRNQGLGPQRMAHHEYETIDETKLPTAPIERTFWKACPTCRTWELMIGENVKEILECDLKLEEMAIPTCARPSRIEAAMTMSAACSSAKS